VIGLLQRVRHADVRIEGASVAGISQGLLVFVGVERGDSAASAERLLGRLLDYRVFADRDGRMNRSLAQIAGGLLLVPQFTLLADTRKGTRPGFSAAARPGEAAACFEQLVAEAHRRHTDVAAGQFGADMQVSLCNDGPVTFWLSVPPDSN
jgi:D-tyrosyl-tRNA(Tyr) deacylase